MEHAVAPASHVAMVLSVELLNVPALPAADVQAAAVHERSSADQVTSPLIGGVNEGAFARSESRSCFEAVDKTIWSTVTATSVATVGLPTFVTMNATVEGTVTLACSLTDTETVVV